MLYVLRDATNFVDELNFVLEKDGEMIGQTAFVRSCIKTDDGRDLPTLSLGPICIANEFKRQGYGKIMPSNVRESSVTELCCLRAILSFTAISAHVGF